MTSPEPWRPRRDREVVDLPDLRPAPPPLDDAELEGDHPRTGPIARASLWLRTRLPALLAAVPYRIGWLAGRLPRWIWYAVRDEVIGFARTAAWIYSWVHLSEERTAIRRMDSRDAKARALREVNKDARYRLIGVGALAAVLALVALVTAFWAAPVPGTPGPYVRWLLVPLLALLLLFEYLGHRQWDTEERDRRRGPLSHGTSSRTLRRDLEEGFAANKVIDVGVSVTVNRYGWHGEIETESKLPDELVASIERFVHAPPGSILLSTNPKNAASHPFKLLIEDPLAAPQSPEDERDLDIRSRHRIGRHMFGAELRVNLRQHIGLIGRSGSGKSSGVWVLMDRIASCTNARVAAGIDLTHGPAIPAWSRAIERVAYDPGDAKRVLEEMIAIAQQRNARLAELAESDDADQSLDENWAPTAADPALYVVVDEFHVLADDKDLLDLVKLLARIGRKGAVYLILATPGASKEDMGSTIIKAMVGLKFLFACVQQDVTNFLGGKMLELGWRPDKLSPSAASNARDAGKAYVWDGDHQDPEIVRINRLELHQCRTRARARALSSPPTPAQPEAPVEQAPALPSGLAVLQAAFAEHEDRECLPTAWVLASAGPEWSAQSLADSVVAYHISTRYVTASRDWKRGIKGYFREDVERAIAELG